MFRLFRWLHVHLWTGPPASTMSAKSDTAYSQLEAANQMIKRTRAQATGNPVADMVTGRYRPQRPRRPTQ